MRQRRPCGKVCWSESKAKGIVLAACYYRHDPRRQEANCYYCLACRAWHTTSQRP